jgi:hypothetical protein
MKRPVIAGRAVRGLTLALLPALGLLSACASTDASPDASRASIEKAPPACFDTTVAIYFERNSAEVTREAQAVLRSAAQMAKGCTVESVRVVGLADAVGAADANQALSEERARTHHRGPDGRRFQHPALRRGRGRRDRGGHRFGRGPTAAPPGGCAHRPDAAALGEPARGRLVLLSVWEPPCGAARIQRGRAEGNSPPSCKGCGDGRLTVVNLKSGGRRRLRKLKTPIPRPGSASARKIA